jgi:hypothetical protein
LKGKIKKKKIANTPNNTRSKNNQNITLLVLENGLGVVSATLYGHLGVVSVTSFGH